MLAWVLYAMCVSLLLGAAALCIERAFRLWGRQTRWVWMAVLVAAVVIPAAISFVVIELPVEAHQGEATTLFRLREATVPALSPERWVADIDVAQSVDTDAFLKRAWLFVSVGMFVLCAAVSLYWSHRLRHWSQATVLGETVRVASDVGPAVVGFVRPLIVLPRWLLEASPATLDAVMAHEREHLKARDPQFLFASLVFICAMPWNAPLWWVVMRLRRAIEIDCDTRVLRDGRDPVAYGSLLLDINQQQLSPSLTAVALTERPTLLETRIRLMLGMRGPQWRWAAASFVCAFAVSITLATQIGPPDLRGIRTIHISDEAFDRVSGYYHFGGLMVMRVGRDGSQRFAKVTGQRRWAMDAGSTRLYVTKAPETEYEFETDESGSAKAVVLRQDGNTFSARRVSDAVGRDLERSFAEKIERQIPTIGTEEALKRVLAELQAGQPDYAKMTPALASAIRKNMDGRHAELVSYGPLRAIEFEGVTPAGSDVYKASFERGANQISVRLTADGRLTRLTFDEWQSRESQDQEAQHYQRQQPLAGSAPALARLLDSLRAGQVSETQVSPGMAAVIRQQMASLQLGLASFGALQSITFDRVAPNGWDVFSVRFEKAVIQCSIELREDGKIVSVLWDM